MEVRELEYPYYTTGTTTSRISWRSVFAGAFVSAAIAGCLGLWGIGIGAVKLSGTGMVTGFGGKAAFWLIITSALSFGVGGWVASRLAGLGSVGDSVLHGLTSWAVALVGVLALYPTIGLIFSPTGLSFGPTAVRTLGWVGFLTTLISGCCSCVGAMYGTRVLKAVPVEEYTRIRRHGGATTTSRPEGLASVGR